MLNVDEQRNDGVNWDFCACAVSFIIVHDDSTKLTKRQLVTFMRHQIFIDQNIKSSVLNDYR